MDAAPYYGKWDTAVRVVRKRRDGNSYVVLAPDGNTYIRGRRLLKTISSANTFPEQLDPDNNTTTTEETENPKTNKGAMPRRSPRNHNSTRAADIELSLIHI